MPTLLTGRNNPRGTKRASDANHMLCVALLMIAAMALTTAANPARAQARLAAAGQSTSVEVTGFRTAGFGMTEDQVRTAIEQDFDLRGADIAAGYDEVTKTGNLAITVGELVPGGGSARIVYVFGHRSAHLIQVNLRWGGPGLPEISPQALTATAGILQNYFDGQGFPEDSMLKDRRLPNGNVLVFSAVDERGRTLLLTLGVPSTVGVQAAGKRQPTLVPTVLLLSYFVNRAEPDMFRLEDGEF